MSLQCDSEVATLNMKGITSFHQKTNLLETMAMDFFGVLHETPAKEVLYLNLRANVWTCH